MSFTISREDLDLVKEVIWPEREVVEFVCLDVEENQAQQRLSFKCKCLSGKFRGRRQSLSLSMKKDNEIQKVRLARWALAFYSEDELIAGNTPLARMIGRKFTAVAARPREYMGRTYQDFDYWKDLGEASPSEKEATAGAAASSSSAGISNDDVPF